MTRILLAVSEQWVADKRIDALGQWAARMQAEILAVNVIYGTDRAPAEKAPGERILEQVATRLRAHVPGVDSLLLFSDDVANALLKTAEEHKATMIVLGLSNKGLMARLFEGDIPANIVKSTRLPILMLPADWQGEL